MKNSLTMRLQNGQKALLAMHKVPGAENSFELFLLHLTATRVGTKP